jgi:hypothetical protein
MTIAATSQQTPVMKAAPAAVAAALAAVDGIII